MPQGSLRNWLRYDSINGDFGVNPDASLLVNNYGAIWSSKRSIIASGVNIGNDIGGTWAGTCTLKQRFRNQKDLAFFNSGYATLAEGFELVTGTSVPFCVFGWFQLLSNAGNNTRWSFGNTATTARIGFRATTTQWQAFQVNDAGTSTTASGGTSDLLAHTYIFIFDGLHVTLYLDSAIVINAGALSGGAMTVNNAQIGRLPAFVGTDLAISYEGEWGLMDRVPTPTEIGLLNTYLTNTWTLTQSLVLSLDADVGTYQDTACTIPATANNATINGWKDTVTPEGHIFATPATGTGGQLKTNVVNGHPAVRFGGASALVNTLAYTRDQGAGRYFLGNAPFTLMVVCATEFNSQSAPAVGWNSQDAVYGFLWPLAGANVQEFSHSGNATPTNANNVGTAYAIITVTYDGLGNVVLYAQGDAGTAGADTGFASINGQMAMSLGASVRPANPTGFIWWTGDIAAVRLWNWVLDSGTRIAARTTLNTKYNCF
jgi:hypothetical protein